MSCDHFYGITTSKMMRSLLSLHGMMVAGTKAVFFVVFFYFFVPLPHQWILHGL